MASVVNIGQMIGSVVGGYLANIFGRQRTMLIMNTFGIIGWILIFVSFDNVAVISIGRFLCGFGNITSTIQVISRGVYYREKSAANQEKNHSQFLGSTYAEFHAELKNYPPFLFWGFWKA